MRHDSTLIDVAELTTRLKVARETEDRLLGRLLALAMENSDLHHRIDKLNGELFIERLRAENWQGRYNQVMHATYNSAMNQQMAAQQMQNVQQSQLAYQQLAGFSDCTCIPGRSSLLAGDRP